MIQYRHRPFVLLAVVALAVGAYSFWWQSQFTVFKATLNTALADKCAPFTVRYDNLAFGGFPYRFEARFTNAVVANRSALGVTATLTTPELALEAQPWRPGFYVIQTKAARLNVVAPGISTAGTTLTAQARFAEASLRFEGKRIARASLVLNDAQGSTNFLRYGAFQAQNIQAHIRQSQTNVPPPGSPSAPDLIEVYLSGAQMKGPASTAPFAFVLDTILTGNAPPACQALKLADWRKSGGALQLRKFSAASTEFTTTGNATLALGENGQMQMAGILTTDRPTWFIALVNGASRGNKRGRVTPKPQPFSIMDGTLTLAGQPIAAIAPLAIPAQ